MDAATSVEDFGLQMFMDRVWLSRKVIIGRTSLRCGGCLDIATVVWATMFIWKYA